MTFEVPSRPLYSGRYCHGQMARALSRSKRDRTFYASVDSLRQVSAYAESERAWAVERAQAQGRYEKLPQMRLITKVTTGRTSTVHWVDRDGVQGRRDLNLLD